jgi:RimJ/RimL family protein N-acetyltransferase
VRLEDDAIALRDRTEADVPAISAACQDPEIARWTQVPSPYTEDDARAFVADFPNARLIVDVETNELLGSIGWRWVDQNVQVGYWVKREARGRGVATRALRLLSRWAFDELRARRVQLLTEPDNKASQRVAEKAGFTAEGKLRSYIELKGRRRDAIMYGLIPEDLPATDVPVG